MRFVIPGPVEGKARPRLGRRGRVYTPAKTLAAEERVREAWRMAGAATLEGPLAMTLDVFVARPAGHYRKHGRLSAAGLRSPVPTKKPDLDNVLKLVADALNKHAYGDDAQLVVVTARRFWAESYQPEHISVELTPWGLA